ncbi:hypothetical protein FPV67DRAFT_1449584 [Lyophyllum atratum]|nr:hypothetical protein FPV67DRAFT_1449584 [Lyophyllum atratum]
MPHPRPSSGSSEASRGQWPPGERLAMPAVGRLLSRAPPSSLVKGLLPSTTTTTELAQCQVVNPSPIRTTRGASPQALGGKRVRRALCAGPHPWALGSNGFTTSSKNVMFRTLLGHLSQTRSGISFSPWSFVPYVPAAVSPASLHDAGPGHVHEVVNDFEDLVQARSALEDASDQGMEDDIPKPLAPITRARLRQSVEARRLATRKKQRRSSKRIKAAQDATPYTRPTRTSRTAKEKLFSQPLDVTLDAKSLPRTKGGAWTGTRGAPAPECRSVQEFVRIGFRHIKWEGSQRRAIVGGIGRPNDGDWDAVIAGAAVAMDDVRRQAIGDDATQHRRGIFFAIATGVSHGTGTLQPVNIKHDKSEERRRVQRLRGDANVRRIAGFQSSAFATFAPKLYRFYATKLQALFNHCPWLCHTFANSIFPACTFNCGPQTCTWRHVDYANLPYGLCAITALGNFDPRTGGQLVLYSLKVVIDFPPGSTVLIPSGSVEHGNCPIAPHETRMSFTQYAAGGLFRYVAYNFKTIRSYCQGMKAKTPKEKASVRLEVDLADGVRWEQGINMFTKVPA